MVIRRGPEPAKKALDHVVDFMVANDKHPAALGKLACTGKIVKGPLARMTLKKNRAVAERNHYQKQLVHSWIESRITERFLDQHGLSAQHEQAVAAATRNWSSDDSDDGSTDGYDSDDSMMGPGPWPEDGELVHLQVQRDHPDWDNLRPYNGKPARVIGPPVDEGISIRFIWQSAPPADLIGVNVSQYYRSSLMHIRGDGQPADPPDAPGRWVPDGEGQEEYYLD